MPQPGDGDLWPTRDDDRPRETPSTPVKDAVTHQLPVPQEPKKPAGGGWFDPPTPAEPAPGSDKSHAEPGPAATWPLAELEQQARKPDTERTVSVRTVPTWSNSAQSSEPAPSAGESGGEEAGAEASEPEEPAKASQLDGSVDGSSEAADLPDAADVSSEAEGQSSEAVAESSEAAGQTDEAADSAEVAEPVEQESAAEGAGSDSSPEPESGEAAKADVPTSAPDEGSAEPESDKQESASSDSDSTDSAEAEAEAEPETEAEAEPEAEPEAEAEPETEVEAEVEADGETGGDQAATPDRDQRGGDHPTVIGQVGGDGTRTGLRAVTVNKNSAPAWPDEQEDRPTGDTTVNLATPAVESAETTEPSETSEPPKAAEPVAEPAEPSKSVESSTVAERSEAAEPAEVAESSETAELPKPVEDSQSTAASGPDEPSKAAEWPKADETPEPAAPAPSVEAGKATEPPKAPEPSKTTESPTTVARFDAFAPAQPVDRTAIVERPRTTEPPRTTESPTVGLPPKVAGREVTPPPPAAPTRQDATDSATVFFPRPVLPPQDQPRADPPSFIRPRQEADSTTFIPRIPQPAQPDRQPERQQDWPPPEPPRAAPQRIGPQPQEPAAPRKKKPLLMAAIAVVAVIGLAAGVVFGVPGLAAKLGLASEDAAAVAPPPAPVTYRPGLHGPDSGAPKPTKDGVAAALAGPISSPALGNVTGVVIDPATGETLFEQNAGAPITPASTGKILTAAAALLSLDHTEQLVTKVVQGEQPGEVIIVGGGDPTISSLPDGEVSMYPGAAHLDELVEQVRNSGVQVQTVYIDQSRYAGPGLAPSWLPEDVGDGYIAPIVPAMLDGDRADPKVNYSPRTTDPGRKLVNAFASRIGAGAAGAIEKKAPANAKVLGEIRSAPLAQLVDNMLDHSDNTLGDILAHEVAVKAGEEASFDGAARAMLNILRQNGFDVDGVVLRDGSGMSIQNKMSAKVLAQVLAVAAGPDGKDPRTNKLRPLLGGLPVAGGSGTLEERYGQDGAAAAGRGWVRAKTGTLSGVNSLAGIVLDQDNRPLVFAFLTEGTQQNSARPALDVVAAALRGCGCQ